MIKSTLLPAIHPNKDFFMADILDASLKDDVTSMEFPLFALRPGDKKVRKYESKTSGILVIPTAVGAASIFDKDIWIFCISQIMAALNNGERVTAFEPVRFSAHDYFSSTNRPVRGRSRELLLNSLFRLRGTTIVTDVKANNKERVEGFGLIERFGVDIGNKYITGFEVELPAWLWRAIENENVLTLHPDYFRIRKPIDRRLYEIARKHCGNQKDWVIGLALLKDKCVYRSELREFRRHLKKLSGYNDLPDYLFRLDKGNDQLVVSKRPKGKGKKTRSSILMPRDKTLNEVDNAPVSTPKVSGEGMKRVRDILNDI